MGWYIHVDKNTLRMSDEVAKKLVDEADDNGQIISYYNDTGLEIDIDALEHADFFHMEWALKILDDDSVNGDITFFCEYGGEFDSWGYRFKNGKVTNLKGVLTYKER